MPSRCLIIGAVMLDVNVRLKELPEPGDDIELRHEKRTLGGCAYNVANIMHHFGATYDLFAPVGKGPHADEIAGKLKAEGKSTVLSTDNGDNGYCLCLVDDTGERTFLTVSGVECHFRDEWFSSLSAGAYDSVYISGYEIEGEGGDAIIAFLRQNPGLKVYFAPGPRIGSIDKARMDALLDLHPVVHLNEAEITGFSGKTDLTEASAWLYERTGSSVIATLGPGGALIYDGKAIQIPSVPVKAADTSGAGDSHIGTIIAMLQSGKSLYEAVSTANLVAAQIVKTDGPVLSDLEFKQFMRRENHGES